MILTGEIEKNITERVTKPKVSLNQKFHPLLTIHLRNKMYLSEVPLFHYIPEQLERLNGLKPGNVKRDVTSGLKISGDRNVLYLRCPVW